MRSAYIAALLVAVSLLLSITAAYTVVEKSGYCARTLTAKKSNADRTLVITGAKGCTDSQSLAALIFSIRCNYLPHFQLLGLGAVNDTESITVAAAAADLLFDSLIEYRETNGIPGYQPLRWNGTHFLPGDHVERWALLGNLIPNLTWKPISHVATAIDDATTVHNISFSDHSLWGLSWFDMRFDVEIASNELRDGRRSLRPNSFKINLDVSNIKYQSSKSTGIAFGMIFATRGGVVKHNITKGMRDGDDDEDMVDVLNEEGRREIYFSWNRTVIVDGTEPVEVKTSDWSIEASTPEGYENQAEFKLNRLWYSIEGRPSSLFWDPTVGSPEAPDNSAGRAMVSLVSIFVAVFVTFALI